jgi:1,2-diacylglycerol 3-alpha-glucosyltransferase
MNILIVTASFLPTINGVATHIVSLKEYLEKEGHSVFILCPKNKNRKEGKGLFEIPSIITGFNTEYPVPVGLFIPKKLKNVKFDLVHLHHPFGVKGLARKIAKKNKAPLIFTNHTQYSQSADYYFPLIGGVIKFFIRLLLFDLYRISNMIICSTDEIKKDVLKIYKKSKVTVIPVSIDERTLSSGPKSNIRLQYQIPQDSFLYLYVGRIAEEKNIDFLLESFSEARKGNDKLRLLVVGSGDHLSRIKKIKGVHFAGAKPQSQLGSYFSQSDIFVSASLVETLGLVFAEALYFGTPVLGMDVPGVRDVVKNKYNGELAKNGEDFVNILKTLPERKGDLASYQKRAKQTAMPFTSQVNLPQILTLYKEALNPASSPKKLEKLA